MTSLAHYVAEEIATDHAEGLLSRREAMRRLGLLGMSLGAASALLTACAGKGDTAATPTPVTQTPVTPTTAAPPGASTALATEAITFAGPASELQAAWAQAVSPRGAVLVIPENKGLTEHHKNVAGRFAGVGYSAMALDLLSRSGGTPAFTDPAEATAALTKTPAADLLSDIDAAIGELENRSGGKKIAMVGFCFGGGLVWQTLDHGESRLAAAIPFYGPGPDDPDFSKSKDVAVLAFYGALDDRVTATRDAMDAALSKAGVLHQLVTEPGANHAFFNDTGPRYNAVAAADAWKRVLDWFGQHVG